MTRIRHSLVPLAAAAIALSCGGSLSRGDGNGNATTGASGDEQGSSGAGGQAASAPAAGGDSSGSNDAVISGSGTGGGPTGPAYLHIASASSFTTLYAMSDVHGHLKEMKNLLVAAGLVDSTSQLPGTVHWTGGDATLVITGDMIDKGPASLDVIEAAMALESAATAANGTVLVLFGNHEAEFLGTPSDSKFTGKDTIDHDLEALSPAVAPADFASGKDPRGAWLRKRPFAAMVGTWFFSHAGGTSGATLAALDLTLGAALAGTAGFTDPAIVGATSLLEARDWYTSTTVVDQNLMALGAHHIVMGHDPNAFSSQGTIVMPATFAGKLFKIDTGLGSGYSNGEILRVRHDGADDVAESLLPNGTVKPLYRGAP